MNREPERIAVNLGKQENTCLIALPAGNLFQIQYDRVIRPSLEDAGLEPQRLQDAYLRSEAIADSWRSLRSARLLVAELTGRDASVLYYIGLAHAIGKPVLTIARAEADVPPALRGQHCLFYDVQDPFWGESLKACLRDAIAHLAQSPRPSAFLEGVTAFTAVSPVAAESRTRTRQEEPGVKSRLTEVYDDGPALVRSPSAEGRSRPTEARPRLFGEGPSPRSPFPLPDDQDTFAPADSQEEPRPRRFAQEPQPRPQATAFRPAERTSDEPRPRSRTEDFLPRRRTAYPEAPSYETDRLEETARSRAEAIAVSDRDADPPRRFPSLARQRRETQPVIAGVWQGVFATEGTEYQGVMKMHQDTDGLSAVMQVTYISRDAQVVVEEEFFGSLAGRDIALNGINYVFVQKGKAKEYTLDNFELTVSADGQRLTGKVKAADVEGEAVFTRVQEA